MTSLGHHPPVVRSAGPGRGGRRGRPLHPGRADPGTAIGSWAFLGFTVVSLGGPLALAALYAPTIVADASGSAGLVTVGAAVLFVAPLLVWLRYSRHVASSGGLYAFVEAAAGHRVALVHAGLWTVSYVLYLLSTTAAIVYDTLPDVLPGVGPYQPLLLVALPLALAVAVLLGRTVTLAVTGVLAVGQLALVAALAAVTVTHSGPTAALPGTSFTAAAGPAAIATASAQTALLYVCGSLPLFLGGEVAHARRTVRRGLVTGYVLVAGGVVATVAPLAANPAFTRAPIPGMSVARVFVGEPFAVTVGLGVAASVAGVMLVELIALSRLLHAVSGRPSRSFVRLLAVLLVAAAPLTLLDPELVYTSLLKPSLIALWLSQLVVFVVYPRFAARHGGRLLLSTPLAAAASAFAVYGMYATVQHVTT